MTQNESDAHPNNFETNERTSGTAGAGLDPQEQDRQRSGTELTNDKILGNGQCHRKSPRPKTENGEHDHETAPNSVIEERVDVGTKNWR
jgi:hypothetical protein